MRLYQYITFIFTAYALTVMAEESSSINQTPDVTPILSGSALPFTVQIEQANFSLPAGIQSFASAIYKNKWLLIAGRTNGLHTFGNTNDNFPPRQQNTTVYVVDYKHQIVYSKSLTDPSSGLTPEQVTQLSVTSPEYYQTAKTLYIAGGYGAAVNGTFTTQPVLSAIDISGLMHWVMHDTPFETAAKYIRQLTNPIFQETGGVMHKNEGILSLLIFGQDFEGAYTSSSNGIYSEQVRRFQIKDNGKKLKVKIFESLPKDPNPNYRRRDLNVVPTMSGSCHNPFPCYIAYSGVFTEAGGIWTVPVIISSHGTTFMADPNDPATFKQGMNNYACATAGLFSNHSRNMYTLFFGGISYGYFDNGVFTTDSEIPFINQVTAIKWDKYGVFSQYIMDAEYPVIVSTGSNSGNPFLFGAGARFFPVKSTPKYDNLVLQLDHLKNKPITIGYIVGGIASTLPNTNNPATDTIASPYIFRVILTPKTKKCN